MFDLFHSTDVKSILHWYIYIYIYIYSYSYSISLPPWLSAHSFWLWKYQWLHSILNAVWIALVRKRLGGSQSSCAIRTFRIPTAIYFKIVSRDVQCSSSLSFQDVYRSDRVYMCVRVHMLVRLHMYIYWQHRWLVQKIIIKMVHIYHEEDF